MRPFFIVAFSLVIALTAFAPSHSSAEVRQPSNGTLWPDAQGQHINAHGGCVVPFDGRYYWFGEHRPDQRGKAMDGVSVYVSDNLRFWTSCGLALSVDDTPGSDIERGCVIERPKVIYNERTRNFVMLFHLELKGQGYSAARLGFAVSDSPTGPFRFVRSTRLHAGKWPKDFGRREKKIAKTTNANSGAKWWTPEWRKDVENGMFLWRDFEDGQMSRDQTVFIDDDGRAYHITSSQENLTLLISELTSDYLGFTGHYIQVAPGGQNEAPTLLKHNGCYWLICSGCTGWAPNKARMFSAPSIWGPWTQHPTPFVSDDNHSADNTFGAQGNFIITHEGRPIFMADVWNPEHLARSLHIWLPIEFSNDGTPVIKWVSSPF